MPLLVTNSVIAVKSAGLPIVVPSRLSCFQKIRRDGSSGGLPRVALHLVERLGYHADQAVNGLEALRALSETDYDVVLMDCQMPELDGYDTTRRIRAAETGDRHIRIIALTANAMKGDEETCLAAGMDDYLVKPIRIEELKSCLERHLTHTPENPSA